MDDAGFSRPNHPLPFPSHQISAYGVILGITNRRLMAPLITGTTSDSTPWGLPYQDLHEVYLEETGQSF